VKSSGFPVNHTLLDGQEEEDESGAESDLDCSDTVDSLDLSFRTAQYGEELELERTEIEESLKQTEKMSKALDVNLKRIQSKWKI